VIAGLLLAAGGARRFGSQKLVAPLDGRPLVLHAATTLAAATDTLVVVVGNDASAVRGALADMEAQLVDNAEWASGLSSSLRTGVAALPPDAAAVVVMLGDEPRVQPAVVRAVIDAWTASGTPIVAARYRRVHGHPVLFARSVFPELLELTGDAGARPVIRRVPDRVLYVEVDADPPHDVDTPDDIARLDRSS
jgi:molybdenum cofactor cytidylyltransferase